MKYVIEIEDVPFSKVRFGDDAQNLNLYRAKGFNALVFDKEGLDKLTLLDKEVDEAYQKGLEEGKKQGADKAWECAKRFVWKTSLNDAASMGFIVEEEAAEILKNYTATAAMKAVELYDEKSKTEIKAGKWNRLDMNTLNCNKCGATFVLNQGSEKMHFCPNCGARMEG